MFGDYTDMGMFISIHAPREGCDESSGALHAAPGISIHAPREGCDPSSVITRLYPYDFNPRTP